MPEASGELFLPVLLQQYRVALILEEPTVKKIGRIQKSQGFNHILKARFVLKHDKIQYSKILYCAD